MPNVGREPPLEELRPLVGPFRPAPAASGDAGPCGPRLTPVRNLEGFGYFADRAFSRPDPVQFAADQAASRPLREWLAAVQRDLARHRRGDAGAAACALATLDHWARNDALLGAFNLQGNYHRAWIVAGASLSFLALRDAAGLEAPRLRRVGRWLAAVARDIRPRHERRSEALISDVRNNQAAWAGLAGAAAGVAAGDRGLLEWGVEQLREQLSQVNERGALPQELRRGAMALHYHLFALEAVAALERLAAANGIELSEAHRAALGRLRDLSLAAAQDPSRMEGLAGAAQVDPWLEQGKVPLSQAAGLDILAASMPDPALDAALAPFRPYADPFLGGEVTGWWLPVRESGERPPGASTTPVTPPAEAAP